MFSALIQKRGNSYSVCVQTLPVSLKEEDEMEWIQQCFFINACPRAHTFVMPHQSHCSKIFMVSLLYLTCS